MSTLMLDNRTQGFENALWRAVTKKKKGQSFTTSVEVIDRWTAKNQQANILVMLTEPVKAPASCPHSYELFNWKVMITMQTEALEQY